MTLDEIVLAHRRKICDEMEKASLNRSYFNKLKREGVAKVTDAETLIAIQEWHIKETLALIGPDEVPLPQTNRLSLVENNARSIRNHQRVLLRSKLKEES